MHGRARNSGAGRAYVAYHDRHDDARQVDLRSDNRFLTCWIAPRVAVRDQVTLKDSDEPARRWDVLRVGVPAASTQIRRGWNNDV